MKTNLTFLYRISILISTLLLTCSSSSLSKYSELIDKYLNHDFMDISLPNIMVICKGNTDLSLEECAEAEYLNEIKQIQETIFSTDEISKTKIKTSSSIKSITGTYNKDSYPKIFEDYIIQKRPFKSLMESDEEKWIDLENFCVGNIKNEEINLVTLDYSLSNCDNKESLRLSLKIPAIASNSYLSKVNDALYGSVYEDNLYSDEKSMNLFNYSDHWPALFLLHHKDATPVHSCPLNMHQVVWGAGKSKITVRLFPSIYSNSFNPSIGKKYPLHFPIYSGSGFVLGQPVNPPEIPPYLETIVTGNEFLFIPENYLASFLVDDDISISNSYLIRHCFVDASNFADFKKSLSVSSKVSQIDKILLNTIMSPSFDLKMARFPVDMTIANFQQFPKPLTDVIVDPSLSTINSEKSNRNRKNKKSSANFRDWQEANKWNMMISALTMPQPYTPEILAIGRRNVTLQWGSPYLPSSIDKTRFGFNITICYENDVKCVTHEFIRGEKLLIENKKLSSRDILSDYDTIFSAVVTNLEPNTKYRFNSIIFYDTSVSSKSPWSNIFTTVPLTIPAAVYEIDTVSSYALFAVAGEKSTNVNLYFKKPIDDGGVEIDGYQVYIRHLQRNHFFDDWQYWGKYLAKNPTDRDSSILSILINNLLPDIVYEFKVSSSNAIGNSSFSPLSNDVMTVHDSFADSHVERKSCESCSETIILNDFKQIISKYPMSEGLSLIGWSSHWSPRKFSVSSGSIWVDPPLANNDIINGNNLRGQIVWVLRGEIGIVFKIKRIQAAGAIGVIIVDDGKCTKFDQKCMPGADKSRGEGFAALDLEKQWKNIKIPIIFVLKDTALLFAKQIGLPLDNFNFNQDSFIEDF